MDQLEDKAGSTDIHDGLDGVVDMGSELVVAAEHLLPLVVAARNSSGEAGEDGGGDGGGDGEDTRTAGDTTVAQGKPLEIALPCHPTCVLAESLRQKTRQAN